MACLVVLLAFISPRLALFGIFLFSDLLSRAFDSWFVPLLGFFLLPWTTLAYAVMWSASSTRSPASSGSSSSSPSSSTSAPTQAGARRGAADGRGLLLDRVGDPDLALGEDEEGHLA